jgi:hypothetical protein
MPIGYEVNEIERKLENSTLCSVKNTSVKIMTSKSLFTILKMVGALSRRPPVFQTPHRSRGGGSDAEAMLTASGRVDEAKLWRSSGPELSGDGSVRGRSRP